LKSYYLLASFDSYVAAASYYLTTVNTKDKGCVPLGGFGSESLIQNYSDHLFVFSQRDNGSKVSYKMKIKPKELQVGLAENCRLNFY